VNQLLHLLRNNHIAFAVGGAGWPPAEVVAELRERGSFTGPFQEIVFEERGRSIVVNGSAFSVLPVGARRERFGGLRKRCPSGEQDYRKSGSPRSAAVCALCSRKRHGII
jgi:hypothetical protein